MEKSDPTEPPADDAETYPETLLITVGSAGVAFEAGVAQLASDSPADEAVRVFDSIAEVWALLTDRRLELMRSIMTAPPDSISDLADRLGRNDSDVHSDVAVLADHDIVYFDTDGRAKRPVIPYECVRIDIEVVGDAGSEPAAVS